MTDLHCDIAILGAGPAGLAAALGAADSGRQVTILDDNPVPGGQIWRDGPGARLPEAARQLRAAVAGHPNIRVLSGARLIGRPQPRALLFERAHDCGLLHWQRLILCCGARELQLPFPGWTLPGVTGAGGLQALLKQGLSVTDERIVIAGSGPLLLAVAASVRQAGGQVVAIIEQTPLRSALRFAAGLWRWPEKARQLPELADHHWRPASQVSAALGDDRLTAVRIRHGGRERELACDRLATGYGLIPNIEPGLLFGCPLAGTAIAVDDYQQTGIPDIFAAGECTGVGGSELALAEGAIAGYAAAGDVARARTGFARRERWQGFARAAEGAFALQPQLGEICTPESLLCRCEDVTTGAVAGAPDWRCAKMAQRCGMGACQGRTCGAAARWLWGWPLPTPQEPLSPARIDTLAHRPPPANSE
ncbi:NAD(P)/FAD-dependent oxidoreductase [Jejubacter calystegiae]|uniref:NAD(P)/FAD-dependent oxidoreductase n=1 Tax=Jejubacter calystegiae TaxID=2579935 RepID=A0A4P8YK41_9ENTR|nr:FAD-dependent oxidoreductase [Jejubacter calystegiae]QCT20463.1 NAD(P)/FAD-dependent oxidoreductase [Jejubacter calystegiae]